MNTPDHVGRDRVVDYVIVGAGPAGLQLAYFLARDNRDYVVLEAETVGHFFTRFPRHRFLISNNKVNTGFTDRDKNLRWDWNSLLSDDLSHLFTDYTSDYFPSADVLVRYLRDFRERFELNVAEHARVELISRTAEGLFTVRMRDGRRVRARTVVVATGHTLPHTPAVPGVELCEQYADISTDPADYRNQRILIVGKGNSGMETAENIFATAASVHLLSPHPVRLAWTTHHVSDVRALYHNTMDSYQLKMQHTILDADLSSITRLGDGRLRVDFRYAHAQGQQWRLDVDRVILCCGFRFDTSLFDQTCAPTSMTHGGRWPEMTSCWESVDVPGLYFAGTIMQARDYKRSFSGFIHGFRYDIRFLSEVFGERYHHQERPSEVIHTGANHAERPGALTGALIARADTASSMFQLPAFLSDVYLLDERDGVVRRYPDIPVDYALDHAPWRERAILLATLEYGHLPPGADPFNFPRDPEDGTTSQFIHPVLRLYVRGELRETYHVPEDLENQWDKPMYVGPCRAAMTRILRQCHPVEAA